MPIYQRFLVNLHLISEGKSDILFKSVIETFLFSQILAKFEMGQRGWQQRSRFGYIRSASRTLYNLQAWATVAYLPHRQCEKPD